MNVSLFNGKTQKKGGEEKGKNSTRVVATPLPRLSSGLLLSPERLEKEKEKGERVAPTALPVLLHFLVPLFIIGKEKAEKGKRGGERLSSMSF